MKQLTYEMIKGFDPCYDPIKYITTDWTGTILDILKMDNIPFEDRLWCVLRTDLVSERVMRLFAVWSYRQTLAFVKDPHPDSVNAALVAERFANNEATEEELYAARSAAWSAAESAARSAAESAARSAAWSAESAAWSAARSAAESAARSAARSAAWSAQRDKLIEMIETENKGK